MKKQTIGIWMCQIDGGDFVTRQLTQRLQALDFEVIANFDMRECYILNGIIYTKDHRNLSKLSVLYHMNIDEQSPYQNTILRLLEHSGVKIFNDYTAFSKASDKLTTNLILRENNIRTPASLFLSRQNFDCTLVKKMFQQYEAIILKKRFGAGGKGVIKFSDYDFLMDYYHYTQACFEEYYLEQYIPFGSQDYRVEIFNGDALSIYSRVKHHAYKTNTHCGGKIAPIDLDKKIVTLAKHAANALGITTTIVDIIRSEKDKQFYVLEINENMGWFLELSPRSPPNLAPSLQTDAIKIESIFKHILYLCEQKKMKPKKPLIALNTNARNVTIQYSRFPTDVLLAYRSSADWVVEMGGIPIFFPCHIQPSDVATFIEKIDGVLMTGGPDIDPRCYQQTQKITYSPDILCLGEYQPHIKSALLRPDFQRDQVEMAVYHEAKKRHLPILGICRGMQLINVAEGGTLIQELAPPLNKAHNAKPDRNFSFHEVHIAPDTRLFEFLQTTTYPSSSMHHQAIDRLGENLMISGITTDNVIEYIESSDPSQFIIGIQGHPGKTRKTLKKYDRVFEQFMAEAM